jgi:hypothetical protein
MMYEVDDELAFTVDRLAPRLKPFEQITFQEGLRRVIEEYVPKHPPIPIVEVSELARRVTIEQAFDTARNVMKKAPSPSAIEYAKSVPELAKHRHFTTWKTITDHLDIDTGMDSARRKLAAWVRLHKPDWPPVPDVEGD